MSERPGHWIAERQATSLPGLFAARAAHTPHQLAYRWFVPTERCWHEQSWAECEQAVGRWRAGLQRLGLERGERVAILIHNSPDWVAVDQAAMSLGLVSVGLFCRDTPASNARILADSGARVLVTAKGRWWAAIARAKACPSVHTVVAVDNESAGNPLVESVASWLPARPQSAPAEPRGDELAALIYTSGTAGLARGAMLTHRNLLWNAYASADAVQVPVNEQLVSFVPLAHAYERTVDYYRALITGGTITFCRHPRFLTLTLAKARPTALVGVPRMFEHYYTELHRTLARRAPWQKRLVWFTIKLGYSVFEHQQRRRRWRFRYLLWPLLRRFVARPCLRPLGGRLEVAVSGAAVLSRPVARTLIGLGLPVLQGYGLTEAGPVVSVNRIDDNDPASVGSLLESVEIRLGRHDDLRLRSPGVMQGYWNDEAGSAEVLDSKGWLYTGDRISRLDQRRLYLTGRLKEIIVMATGDKASPEPLERMIALDPLFSRVVVVGEARPYLAAVTSCDPVVLANTMREAGLDPDSANDLKSARLERLLLRRIEHMLGDFPAHAQVRRVAPTTDSWTVDTGLVTPTNKPRRRQIARVYDDAIRRLYGRRAEAEKTDISYNVNVG